MRISQTSSHTSTLQKFVPYNPKQKSSDVRRQIVQNSSLIFAAPFVETTTITVSRPLPISNYEAKLVIRFYLFTLVYLCPHSRLYAVTFLSSVYVRFRPLRSDEWSAWGRARLISLCWCPHNERTDSQTDTHKHRQTHTHTHTHTQRPTAVYFYTVWVVVIKN